MLDYHLVLVTLNRAKQLESMTPNIVFSIAAFISWKEPGEAGHKH